MKNLGLILFSAVIALVLANMSLYTVDQREYALVFRLGQIVKVKKEPGIYVKLPLSNAYVILTTVL